MSSPTRKRRERGDENDSDWATHPSPRRQHTDSSGDDSDSEGSRSGTSSLWQVLHDPSAFKDQDWIDFQPKAFLALIEDGLCNHRDEVDDRVQFAARSILTSRIFDKFFKQFLIYFYFEFTDNSDSFDDEFRLLHWIDSIPFKMSWDEVWGPEGIVDSIPLNMSWDEVWGPKGIVDRIDWIVSHIIFTMWDGKDWLLDRLPLIERIVAFIADQMDGKDKMDDLCPIKQIVSFIRKIISEKDGRIDKLWLIRHISNVIVTSIEDCGVFIYSAEIMETIADDLLVLKKDDPVDQLNLIDLIISYLDVKRAEKGAEVDKLCLIEGMASFIDGIIIDKDDQVGKLGQIMQILNLLENIDEFGSYVNLCNLELMKHIVTLLEMIKGEKDDQVDKLSLMEHIISFLEDDRRFDKLKLMQYIVSRSRRKLLGHRSCRTIDEAFDGELEARNKEIERLTKAPSQDTVMDTLKGYKGRSKYMQYFMKQEGNKWLCNLCGKDDPLERKVLERNKGGTTTPFLRHLEKFHIKEYSKIRDAEKHKNMT